MSSKNTTICLQIRLYGWLIETYHSHVTTPWLAIPYPKPMTTPWLAIPYPKPMTTPWLKIPYTKEVEKGLLGVVKPENYNTVFVHYRSVAEFGPLQLPSPKRQSKSPDIPCASIVLAMILLIYYAFHITFYQEAFESMKRL